MSDEKVRTEEFQVKGEEIVAKIKELLHEGNIRRVIIKNERWQDSHRYPIDDWSGGRFACPSAGSYRRHRCPALPRHDRGRES